MKIILLLAVAVLCILVYAWSAKKKSDREIELARKKKKELHKNNGSLLKTPGDYLLAKPGVNRYVSKENLTSGVLRTNTFALKSESTDPEYDGFSRRDRHHVRDRGAQIKGEGHLAH